LRWSNQRTVAGWLTPDCNNHLPTSVDYVGVDPVALPTSGGNLSVQIPWNYRAHGASDDGYNFRTLPQATTATSAGGCTTTKNDVTVSFNASDPTVGW
jgi:hypothetical protein